MYLQRASVIWNETFVFCWNATNSSVSALWYNIAKYRWAWKGLRITQRTISLHCQHFRQIQPGNARRGFSFFSIIQYQIYISFCSIPLSLRCFLNALSTWKQWTFTLFCSPNNQQHELSCEWTSIEIAVGRPVTSLGHQDERRVPRGHKFFLLCPIFLHCVQQWRLVVKLAGRAARFHLWLNTWDCRPGCFYIVVAFPVTPAALILSNS